jgi:IMP dehydrogenase/GMP reductase
MRTRLTTWDKARKIVGMDLLEYVRGCTFDDFLLTPQRGVLPRRDPAAIDLTSRVSERISLRRPLVSANMDTVTRAAMAAVLAEEGGIGFIDRGFRQGDIEPQVTEVSAVKRTQHGVIADPHIGAVRDRLDLEDADPRELEAIGAEGLEVSVPARGSARTVVQDMIKHVCSAVSYGGAETLEDMRRQFWADPGRYLIKLSASARRESFDR